VARAGMLNLPLALAIIGGEPARSRPSSISTARLPSRSATTGRAQDVHQRAWIRSQYHAGGGDISMLRKPRS
jgi:hypothetical protein